MPYRRILTFLFIVLAFSMLNCAGKNKVETPVTEDKKETDLIELLNTRQIKPSDMVTEAEKLGMDQRLAQLEEFNKMSTEEINTLRAEILLRDEKIRQLETKKEEPVKKVVPPKEEVKPAKIVSDYVKAYNMALGLFMQKKYTTSLNDFKNLLERDSQHILSDNCQYWIGESYFALKNYRNAIIAFEKVFTYIKSNKDDDSQLKLGICFAKLGDNERAKEELKKFISNYPKSEYINRAKRMLSDLN